MHSRFALKLIAFILPFIALFAIPTYVLLMGGELTSVKHVAQVQLSSTPKLFGLAYSNPDKAYKLTATRLRQPTLLALGTSRVMQFRNEMFPGTRFYNAGGGISDIGHYSIFLHLLPKNYHPAVMIISLDPEFFNDRWDRTMTRATPQSYQAPSSATIMAGTWKQIYEDLHTKKFHLGSLHWSHDAIGLNAILRGNGFRNDGSYMYGSIIMARQHGQSANVDIRDVYARITQGTQRFETGTRVSPTSLAVLDTFLTECQHLGIRVVGFIPPYAPSVQRRLASRRDAYQYIFQAPQLLTNVFHRHNAEFYDYRDVSSLGITDENMIDGIHVGERGLLTIVHDMLIHGSILNRFASQERILHDLHSSTDPLVLY
jgi:hypothetical protein